MLTLGSMLAGRYRAEALLGGGALGQVYRAWDEGTGGPVALRVLSADLLTDPYYVERLQRKAEALARLQHPGIARLQQIALDDGQPLLVMDYVEGSTLRQRLDAAAGPLPAGEILQVCEQICAALQYAHARGVLCGDLHPDNVLLANDGAVLLADYGLARTLADSALEPRSPDAPPPAYRSPEQCRGDAIDARADVYALGALLYEMSTGRPPFTGADLAIPGDSPAQRTCYEQMHAVPPRPSGLNSALSEAVDQVILRSLAKAPEARYPDAQSLADGLRAALPQSGAARPADSPQARIRLAAARRAAPQTQTTLTVAGPSGRTPRRWPRWAWTVPAAVALALTLVLFARLRDAATSAAASALPVITPADYALAADPAVLQLSPDLALQLVTVPAGSFVMGTQGPNAEVDSNEMPQHAVHLDEYQIGRYEVTVAQWRRFVEATGYEGAPGALVDPDDYPVCFVNWDDAMAFCSWASQLTGRNVSLPTEAQWEKAARGADGRTHPWGEAAPTCALANYYAEPVCANYRTAVGSLSPAGDSPYGCADMAGNVWEWAHDWYDPGYYASSPQRNPQGPDHGMFRVLRGGGWVSNYWRMRVTFRFRGDASFRCADLGFRVCVTPD